MLHVVTQSDGYTWVSSSEVEPRPDLELACSLRQAESLPGGHVATAYATSALSHLPLNMATILDVAMEERGGLEWQALSTG